MGPYISWHTNRFSSENHLTTFTVSAQFFFFSCSWKRTVDPNHLLLSPGLQRPLCLPYYSFQLFLLRVVSIEFLTVGTQELARKLLHRIRTSIIFYKSYYRISRANFCLSYYFFRENFAVKIIEGTMLKIRLFLTVIFGSGFEYVIRLKKSHYDAMLF